MSEGPSKAPEKRQKFQAIKGVRDLLPPETELWNRVEHKAREVFGTFAFGEIRLPIFEPTELFARAVGADTDVVSKEMYSFDDRDETSISLRTEATASVCRAYIENGMQQLPQPVKLYYMGPMFRRERPQKGRYRQFYQIGAEVLGGSDAPAIDAEVMGRAVKYGMVTMPGVFTPTEAFQALRLGASALKFFPASVLGAAGISAMRAVLPATTLVGAVGGDSEKDFAGYKAAGVSVFGLGSSLFKPGMSVDDIAARARAAVAAWDAAFGGEG